MKFFKCSKNIFPIQLSCPKLIFVTIIMNNNNDRVKEASEVVNFLNENQSIKKLWLIGANQQQENYILRRADHLRIFKTSNYRVANHAYEDLCVKIE